MREFKNCRYSKEEEVYVKPFADWIEDFTLDRIVPQFVYKNSNYADTNVSEFYAFDQMARRHFYDEYVKNKWFAMARVAAILADKQQLILANHPDCEENEDRILDCLVYDFFRAYFIMKGNEERRASEPIDVEAGNVYQSLHGKQCLEEKCNGCQNCRE